MGTLLRISIENSRGGRVEVVGIPGEYAKYYNRIKRGFPGKSKTLEIPR